MDSTVWSSTLSSTTTKGFSLADSPPDGPPPGGPDGPGGGGPPTITNIQKKFGSLWIHFSLSLRLYWSHQQHHYLSSTNTSFYIDKFSLHRRHDFGYDLSSSLYL